MFDLLKILRSSKFDHWSEAFYNLLFSLIGGLAPLYISMILIKLFSGWIGYLEFFKHGELPIYSASFLASALYITIKNFKRNKLGIIIIFIGILVSVILFSGIVSHDTFARYIKLDEEFLFTISWPLFIFSIFAYFFSTLSDNILSEVDFQKETEGEYDDFKEKFNKLNK